MAAPAGAAITAVRNIVLVPADASIDDDLLAGANRVLVSGTVVGDLVAAAFGEVRVTGVVDGDVLALAPLVRIDGEVTGSVRVIGGRLEISEDAVVGGDVLSATATADLDGALEGDLFGAALLGEVGGPVGAISMRGWSLLVDGPVDRRVEFLGWRLALGDGARVGGSAVSTGPIDVAEGAEVVGSVRRSPVPALPLRARSVLVLTALGGLVVAVAAGPLLAAGAPGWLSDRIEAVRRSPGRTALRGALLVVVPVAAVAAGAYLAGRIPSLTVGTIAAVLAVLWLAFAVVAATLGAVPLAVGIGHAIVGGSRSHLAAHLVGAVLIVALLLVPWVGAVVAVVAAAGAIGAAVGRGTARPAPGWFTQPSSRERDRDQQGGGGDGGDDEDADPQDLWREAAGEGAGDGEPGDEGEGEDGSDGELP